MPWGQCWGAPQTVMSAFDRYILRDVLGAFLLVLVSLTAVIWLTHALREIDLMTNQGQTILVFIGITGLLIPLLVLVIAPIALVLAVSHTLNRLNTDSEIVVMSASGMSPWRAFRPFIGATLIVSLLVGFISAYLAPTGLRELRHWALKVRTDLVSNIIVPGRFTTIERGLTIHIRERRPDGQLVGIFIDDRRDPKERMTSLAEYGEIVEAARGNMLVLVNGNVQKFEPGRGDPTIVNFDRYGFDLSKFSGGPPNITFGVRERNLIDLMFPDPNDPVLKQLPTHFSSEMHDRLVAPVYPIAFTVIAFAILGAPRTSRQSRAESIALTIVAIGALRLIGFACNVIATQTFAAIIVLYASLALAFGFGLTAIARGSVVELPSFIVQPWSSLFERLARRLQPG